MGGEFGSVTGGVDRPTIPVDDEIVDAVLGVAGLVRDAVKLFRIGFVVGEQQFGRAFAKQPAASVAVVVGLDHPYTAVADEDPRRERVGRNDLRPGRFPSPPPGI
jgi:hypothetical protein